MENKLTDKENNIHKFNCVQAEFKSSLYKIVGFSIMNRVTCIIGPHLRKNVIV